MSDICLTVMSASVVLSMRCKSTFSWAIRWPLRASSKVRSCGAFFETLETVKRVSGPSDVTMIRREEAIPGFRRMHRIQSMRFAILLPRRHALEDLIAVSSASRASIWFPIARSSDSFNLLADSIGRFIRVVILTIACFREPSNLVCECDSLPLRS